jgi:hypothetical protein
MAAAPLEIEATEKSTMCMIVFMCSSQRSIIVQPPEHVKKIAVHRPGHRFAERLSFDAN